MQGGLRMKINLADLAAGRSRSTSRPVLPPPKPGGIIMFSATPPRPSASGRWRKSTPIGVAESLQGNGSSCRSITPASRAIPPATPAAAWPKTCLRTSRAWWSSSSAHHDAAVRRVEEPARHGVARAAGRVRGEPPLDNYRAARRGGEARADDDQSDGAGPTSSARFTASRPTGPQSPTASTAPVLSRYNQAVRRLAGELGVPLVEVHDAFTAKNPDKPCWTACTERRRPPIVADLLVPVIRQQLR